MSRILSLAVAVTFLGCTGLALAQQPDSYSYRHRSFSGNTTEMMLSRDTGRSANRSFSGSTTEMTPTRDAGRGANQFASENEARSRCGNDTVVWVNTKTHVYHFAGNAAYGHTKHGAFICRADADRAGSFRAAKNEKAPSIR